MFLKYLMTQQLEISTAEPTCLATVELFVALGGQHPEALKKTVESGQAVSFAGGLRHSLLVVSFFCAALMSLAEEIQSLWLV